MSRCLDINVTELNSFARALADPTRVRIVAVLRDNELCVCELTDALELSQSTLSSHLKVIRQAGLVTAVKRGKWVYYALAQAHVQIIDLLFAHHRCTPQADEQLRADKKRLDQRLRLRTNGLCVVGFVRLDALAISEGGESTI